MPGRDVSLVVREAIGMSRLLSKPSQIQGRQHCQSDPSRAWGYLVSNIVEIVPKKNFGAEEEFRDNR